MTMTVLEAARIWGVSEERVRQWIRSGRIMAVRKYGYEIPDNQERPAKRMPGPKRRKYERA